jgi:hypothetical protein
MLKFMAISVVVLLVSRNELLDTLDRFESMHFSLAGELAFQIRLRVKTDMTGPG